MMRHLIIAAAAVGFASSANAAEGFDSSLGKVGRWSVYANTDVMTDQKNCVALFDDRPQIQFTMKSIAIGLRGRGGIQSYQIRLDEAPARPLRLASRVERDMGAVFIDGKLYEEAIAATRLRFQGLSILNSLVDEDIDLSSVPEIKRLFAQAGCSS